MSTLSRSIGEYVDQLLHADEEIVHADAAALFIRQHGDVIGFHVEAIVAKQISAEIKRRSQAPAPPLGQGVLFAGLPAAVTVRPGVTKPIMRCTRDDLMAGLEQKDANITAAVGARLAYLADLDRLLPQMAAESTVADVLRQGLAGAA
jgi:hypothetical protein